MKRFLREPLLHFVLIAAAVFAGYGLVSGWQSDADRTIYVSTADIERMAALYATEAGTLPSADDIRAMVADHIRQEALVRDARRLGLDIGDVVVERRLAQKMSFMVADLVEPEFPDDAVLKAWYEDRSEKFERPARATFQHVFFADLQDPRIDNGLAELNRDGASDWRAFGDPFILQREYANLPERETVRVFGASFAGAIFTQAPAQDLWFGPVTSAYGAHFYRVTARTDAELPDFESVREAVVRDWTEANRRTSNAEAIAKIVDSYDVVIEGIDP